MQCDTDDSSEVVIFISPDIFTMIEETYIRSHLFLLYTLNISPVACWHWIYSHMQTVLNSKQNVDNVIPTRERYIYFGYTTLGVGVTKTAGNIRI